MSIDYKKKLEEMTAAELKTVAANLNIPRRAAFTRKEELLNAIRQYPDNEIKKALGLDWWERHKKLVFYIGLYGAIASIIALALTPWFQRGSKEDTEALKKANTTMEQKLAKLESTIELKIGNPAAVQEFKKEFEEKYKSMEQTLENLKTGDKRARDEALLAFRAGDNSKAKKLFEALHPDNTLYQNEAGYMFYTLGKYEQAIQYFEKALKICEKFLGTEHQDTIKVRQTLEAAKQKKK